MGVPILNLGGYVGTGVAMLTVGHSSRWLALYLAAEFAVLYLILVKTGQQYFVFSNGHATSVFIQYGLMMQFVPWIKLRATGIFGGALFAGWDHVATVCEHGRVCAGGEGHCDVEVLRSRIRSIAGRGFGRHHRRDHVQRERHPSLDTLSNSIVRRSSLCGTSILRSSRLLLRRLKTGPESI